MSGFDINDRFSKAVVWQTLFADFPFLNGAEKQEVARVPVFLFRRAGSLAAVAI